jgi:putative flippase GtrA
VTLREHWRGLARPIRYTLVGALCAVLNNALLIGTVWAGLGYLAAVWLICAPMLAIGYLLHVVATFETKPSPFEFLRYSLGILASYPVWIGSLYVFCDLFAWPIAGASLAATLVVFAWNYLATHVAFLGFARAVSPSR